MERLRPWFGGFVLLVMIGCEEPAPPPRPKPSPPSAQNAKIVLREIAATGIVNSGITTFVDYVAYLRKTDAAKADTLAEGLSEMMKAAGHDDIDALKAKAKELAEKL